MPSLELGIEDPSLSCGDGLSCAYRDTISWQNATSPLPMQNNPQVVFERLFGDGARIDPVASAERQAADRSALDSVMERISELKQRLGADDAVLGLARAGHSVVRTCG